MKKKLVCVIGLSNSGKSTIIQSLTGCKTKTFRGRITDKSSGAEIEVVAASPQELDIHRSKLRRMMKDAANRKKSVGMIIAIQPKKPRKRISLEEILSMSENLLEPSFFALVPGHKGRTLDKNDLGKRIGQGQTVHLLNAERFAHLNASIIRDTAGLF